MSRLVPLILAVALFMEQVDSTVISTALPVIAADLGTAPIALKLALTSYYVALAVFIPVSGWMADRFGAKPVFIAAIAVFMTGSLACAQAGTLGGFVAARFLQGMGGAMMTPVARLVLVRAVPKAQLVSAMAWLTIPALIGPLIGPPLGGFISTFFTWHWIFLVNIPIGLAGMLATWRFLPAIRSEPAGRLDALGFLLAGLAASGLLFGFSVVSLPALPVWVGLAGIALGAVSLAAYLRHARRHPAPLLSLGLFRNQVFRAAVTGGSLFRVGIGALPFLIPLMLQLAFGLTAFQSGMITFVGAIGAIAMKFAAHQVYARLGFRTVLISTGAISALTYMGLAFFGLGTPYAVLYALLLVGGFGRSLFFTGINALTFSAVEPAEAAQATALASVIQQLSIAAGVALAGTILEVSTLVQDRPLALSDFHLAYSVIGFLGLAAIAVFWRLPPDSGDEASGRAARREALRRNAAAK
jgi:EmrB/QacA subfamily drug resistance transporter